MHVEPACYTKEMGYPIYIVKKIEQQLSKESKHKVHDSKYE